MVDEICEKCGSDIWEVGDECGVMECMCFGLWVCECHECYDEKGNKLGDE